MFLPSTSSIYWCLGPNCIQIMLCQCQAHWKTFLTTPVNFCTGKEPLPHGDVLGKENGQISLFCSQVPMHWHYLSQFLETEECCTVCFPITLYLQRKMPCACSQEYRHICIGKLWVSFCTACLNLWLKCMAWSMLMGPTVGVFPLPTGIFEADPVKLKCLESTTSS